MGRKTRRRSERREAAPANASPPAVAEVDVAGRGALAGGAIAATVLLFVLVTVWAVPRPAGDTFVGLAGGRDVFQGRLATPDDWSFTTSGRVWLNQNWGFDALMYAAYRAAGEGGLLGLKAAMILAIVGAAAAMARRRGAGWACALTVTAFALAGTRQYLELRANLATYLIAGVLLLLLHESLRRPRLVWLAVPLIAVWANLHGGFVLGLGLLGLWIAAGALDDLRTGGALRALRRALEPAGALAAAAVAAGTLNPFGLANLTYPFTYVSSPEWRGVTEWRPVAFAAGPGTTSAWELVGLAAFVVCATAWRMLARRGATEAPGADGRDRFRLAAFDAALVVLTTWMGLSAVRMLPLALVLLAPLAAVQAEALLRGRRPWLFAAIGSIALAAAVAPFASRAAATYAKGNPRFGDESVFLRMAGNDKLPSGAADFLQDNGASGRVFADWTWEGYLRWRCPQLRFFIGGRATQIYTLDTLHDYGRFQADPQPAALLARWDVHLVAVPLEKEYLHIVDLLAFSEGSHWALVFYDGRSAVLADLSSPATRSLAERVAGGQARFRSSPAAALSGALCRITSGAAVDTQALEQIAAANRALPTAGAPWFVLFAARAHRVQPRWVVVTLEGEYDALARGDGRSETRIGALESRLSIAQILANLYGRAPQAKRWIETREELLSELQSLIRAP